LLSAAVQGRNDEVGESVGEQDDGDAGEQDASDPVQDHAHEIAWTGTTMGIKAVYVFRFQASNGGTLAHSEESWEGLIARLLKGYSRKTLDKGIRSILSHLKAEAERRAATA
jgi:hypothetical protein